MNRIFIDCHGFDQGGQGTVSYIRNLYKDVGKNNSNIDFYFGANNIEKLKEEFGEEANIHYIKYASRNKFIRLIFLIPYYEIKYRFTYIHMQYYLPIINFCKSIVTIHDVLFLDYPDFFSDLYVKKNRFLFKKSAKKSNILLTVSDYSKKRIEFFFKPKKEIKVITNSINIKKDIKYNLQKEDYILYVSRIETRKNHINLCKAFLASNLSEDVSLFIVGRKDEGANFFYDYLDTLTTKDRKRISIFENVSNEMLNEFYLKAKLFVFPSLCEGFGIPPLEAIQYGLSTICAKNTAMEDFEFFGDRFFDASNIDDMKNKMEFYYGNNTGVEEMYNAMIEKYSTTKVNKEFELLLNQIF